MDQDIIKHSYRVAVKMIEIGKKYSMNEEELEELFLLGYLHDIGYQADTTIDKYGNDVGQERRREVIKNRYGEDSIQYKNCVILVNELKK